MQTLVVTQDLYSLSYIFLGPKFWKAPGPLPFIQSSSNLHIRSRTIGNRVLISTNMVNFQNATPPWILVRFSSNLHPRSRTTAQFKLVNGIWKFRFLNIWHTFENKIDIFDQMEWKLLKKFHVLTKNVGDKKLWKLKQFLILTNFDKNRVLHFWTFHAIWSHLSRTCIFFSIVKSWAADTNFHHWATGKTGCHSAVSNRMAPPVYVRVSGCPATVYM